jgi:membrane protein implicated in regulation of membrane protease activity
MTALADLEPLAILGAVLLVLVVASRAVGLAARLAIWLRERIHGPEELYRDGRAAEGRLARYGQARSDLAPRGRVFVSGELWHAVADGPVAAGDRIEVVGREGLELRVRPVGRNHD